MPKSFKSKFEAMFEGAKSSGALKTPFSLDAIKDFCFWINEPINGINEEIGPCEKVFTVVGCLISGDGIEEPIFVHFKSQPPDLLPYLKQIQPRACLNIEFVLRTRKSGKLMDLSKMVSIFFNEDEFIVEYQCENNEKGYFTKPYFGHLLENEIIVIRDQICNSFLSTIAQDFKK
jgi:hypothetical protein